ncbi:hypothetical protein SPRG_02596 [Saprolegnia parasitica CBS 223.65]|uniref:Uncharacterized protein n=1 Tax=Saprolegnia parasitica (strain CBS 223.65) TaxID=695850 RepID=A0A067CUH0_SAPPC|nr:hypothetical protein SPRG_02596 [Saprolegnia parasitica CBS 223.65]KDO32905.1 hypothetical protein SPRG_02596 [Saprolegnia parasitica CBS 223.65]|eukprot:XP_012196554.1 hypothetical protein SPRG_02596 [Saprolegnia parasitica CBS 223.65]
MSPLRVKIWHHWTAIWRASKMHVDADPRRRLANMFAVPIWLQMHPLYQVDRSPDGKMSLAVKYYKFRSFDKGCLAVETERHALWACPDVQPLWDWYLAAWSAAGISWSWDTVVHPETFAVPRHARPLRHVFVRLWYSLVATALCHLWMPRNKIKFEAAGPLHMPSARIEKSHLPVGPLAHVWSNVNGGTCWFKSARGPAQTKLGVRSSLVLF